MTGGRRTAVAGVALGVLAASAGVAGLAFEWTWWLSGPAFAVGFGLACRCGLAALRVAWGQASRVSGDLLTVGLALLAVGVVGEVRGWPWALSILALSLGAGAAWSGLAELVPAWRKAVWEWADAARGKR